MDAVGLGRVAILPRSTDRIAVSIIRADASVEAYEILLPWWIMVSIRLSESLAQNGRNGSGTLWQKIQLPTRIPLDDSRIVSRERVRIEFHDK